jgi:hypothetical protein
VWIKVITLGEPRLAAFEAFMKDPQSLWDATWAI